jgi:hypothetical protein
VTSHRNPRQISALSRKLFRRRPRRVPLNELACWIVTTRFVAAARTQIPVVGACRQRATNKIGDEKMKLRVRVLASTVWVLASLAWSAAAPICPGPRSVPLRWPLRRRADR